ncbi:MAG: hypothetical protein H6815_02965 [Phycisphaeraceae bacterium]|nr:hypothetical protein [Phycisphaerales bacterium]MCB9859388.1 hypothetical protein [Phycisphaeraceae bacterium]
MIAGWRCDGSGPIGSFVVHLGASCYADYDGSGPLNIFDYICFGNEFATGCK